MRKAFKDPASQILADALIYKPGNSTNNKKIADILLKEQKHFCAYTDEPITVTDEGNIDHFNPTHKNTHSDGYKNWFVVKSKWNKHKSKKWEDYQPVLDPTADDFEERIIYKGGDYIAKSSDIEANNLIRLLKLDNPILAQNRKKYISRKKEVINLSKEDAFSYFSTLLRDDICRVFYPRAIKEEFGIDILEMLV